MNQVLKIIGYPDPRLREVSKPIDTEQSGWLKELGPFLDELVKALYMYDGVAIAAPQVAARLRIIVVDLRPDTPAGRGMPPLPLVMINPTWKPLVKDYPAGEVIGGLETPPAAALVAELEGCLSFPGVRVMVRRHPTVSATWIGKDGEPVEQEFTGLQARAIQHECDHLDGRLLIDFVTSPLRRDMVERKMRKNAKLGGPKPRRRAQP